MVLERAIFTPSFDAEVYTINCEGAPRGVSTVPRFVKEEYEGLDKLKQTPAPDRIEFITRRGDKTFKGTYEKNEDSPGKDSWGNFRSFLRYSLVSQSEVV